MYETIAFTHETTQGQRLISNGKVRPSGGSRRPASRC
jgi:hypothetical protein